MMLRFHVLGGIEMMAGDRVCTPRAPKVQSVLALLLLRANSVVSTDAIFSELWGDMPPRSAVTTTQTYIYQLRRRMLREGGATGAAMLVTRASGYRLDMAADQLDANRFAR